MLIDENIDVLLLQETHTNSEEQLRKRGTIFGYTIVGVTYHNQYGTATYVRNNLKWNSTSSTEKDCVFVTKVTIEDLTIINIYKPLGSNLNWISPLILNIQHPTVIMGDFNSHHTLWGYIESDKNGEAEDLALIHDTKQRGTFHSARWRRDFSPDLCFVSRDKRG